MGCIVSTCTALPVEDLGGGGEVHGACAVHGHGADKRGEHLRANVWVSVRVSVRLSVSVGLRVRVRGSVSVVQMRE
jgi:hypothetical protein